ncbi:hypothetical protein CORC01_11097 [Colletotrichum orchidophilum]|uniref:Uncharacterized protein n=1 Tax=Colletotrichum orchidophilum TaxID=1209926 RepID=A0A1G4AWQ6_9PEZI|nr:uncharacterized protein CORC01_11097 [Colletotrichum orchidophilum]OHE93598.1 hypothetical protein CORC01_11097 [Colletotrichum orchidophilum]
MQLRLGMYEGRFGLGKGGRPECSVCHGGTTSAVSRVKLLLLSGINLGLGLGVLFAGSVGAGCLGFLLSWFVARSNPAAAWSGIYCRRKDNKKRGGYQEKVRVSEQ